jgi:hypothetical protein
MSSSQTWPLERPRRLTNATGERCLAPGGPDLFRPDFSRRRPSSCASDRHQGRRGGKLRHAPAGPSSRAIVIGDRHRRSSSSRRRSAISWSSSRKRALNAVQMEDALGPIDTQNCEFHGGPSVSGLLSSHLTQVITTILAGSIPSQTRLTPTGPPYGRTPKPLNYRAAPLGAGKRKNIVMEHYAGFVVRAAKRNARSVQGSTKLSC